MDTMGTSTISPFWNLMSSISSASSNITAMHGGAPTTNSTVYLWASNASFNDSLDHPPDDGDLFLKRPRFSPDIMTLVDIVKQMDRITPVALSLGVVGNVVAMLAFTVTPLKSSSLSHYLTALAVADVMNLVASLVLWISRNAWDIYSKVGVCQITSFVLLMSRFLVVWYLLSAHVERLLVQFGRPGSKRWCTVFRTKCVIIAIFILSLVAFLHSIWSHVVIWQRGQFTCTTMQESVIHINRLRRVELVLALFLPMLMMLLIDGALIYKLVSVRIRHARTRSSSGDRMLTSLRAKGGEHHSLRSTEKDFAQAENGEVTALSKAPPSPLNRGSVRDSPSTSATRFPSGGMTRTKGGGGGENGARSGSSNNADNAADGDGRLAASIDLSKEKWRSTFMCMVVGLVFIGLTFPSAYLRARMNFNEQKGRLPLTHYELYLMQVFERINQFAAVYKVVFYVLFLRSFRLAVFYLAKAALRCTCCKRREPVTTV